MGKFKQLWTDVRSSLWFLPLLVLAAMIGLAYGLIELDRHQSKELMARWPRFFATHPEGSRAMLAAIASSMITVAGVVFSITIVALAQASTQYSPRVLRNFMRDRGNQVVLGVFVGIFAYCLVVLRNITGSANGTSVPPLAVLVGFLLSLLGIIFLIYFIHHIATSIQASEMVAGIAEETTATIAEMFPEPATSESDEQESHDTAPPDAADGPWHEIPAPATGYLQRAEIPSLLRLACRRQLVIHMAHRIGEFVVIHRPVVWITSEEKPDSTLIQEINSCLGIDSFRTVEQDPSFGARQIVDIALKALSPSMNDTGTAITCIDYLSAIICQLAPLRLEPRRHVADATLRVVTKGTTFSTLLDDAFQQILENAEGNSAILLHLLRSLERILEVTRLPKRRQFLQVQLESVAEAATRSIHAMPTRQQLEEQIARARQCFQHGLTPADRSSRRE